MTPNPDNCLRRQPDCKCAVAGSTPKFWKSEKRQVLIAMAAFLVVAGAVVIVRGKLTAPTTAYNEQFRMARYLLHGTGFVCPVGPERNDPSSWYSPGYIAMMAGVMAIFGEASPLSLAVIRLLNIAAMSLAVGLYFLLAKRLFGSRVAWIALVMILLSPSLMYKADEIWDTSWAMLGGAALMAMFVLLKPTRPSRIFASGLACGAVAMINPSFTLCYPIWILYSWWRQRPDKRKFMNLLRYAGLILGGFVLAILPWTIRNHRAFGEFFYLRGNLPMELWVGNAPWSDGYFFSKEGRRIHPVFDAAEQHRMVELGEYGYFRACRADVAEWWRQEPGRFFRLGLKRVRWFWLGRFDLATSRTGLILRILGVTLPGGLAMLGILIVILKKRGGLVLAGTAMVFPVIYYASIVMVRYRLAIEPLVMVLAALTLAEAWRLIATRRQGGRHSIGSRSSTSTHPAN
jgi:4-amino-4-deoxy-L-arabinose transferase-like glycosyltransferase